MYRNNAIYIWKYNNENYFDSALSSCIDKICLPLTISKNMFPIFHKFTEDSNIIASFKTGDFDIIIPKSGIERSLILNTDINTFLRGGISNYKFLIAVQYGRNKFYGTFTNNFINANYLYQQIKLTVKSIETELEEFLKKLIMRELLQDITVEDFFRTKLFPWDVQRCSCYTLFASYSKLLDSMNNTNEYMFRWRMHESGWWNDNLNIWEELVQLMQGLGLLYKVVCPLAINIETMNSLNFSLVITAKSILPNCETPFIYYDVNDNYTINKNKKWLMLLNRRFSPVAYNEGYESEPNVYDGWIYNGSDYFAHTDIFRDYYFTPTDDWMQLGFINHPTVVPTRYSYFYNNNYTPFFTDINLTILDIPMYHQYYNFEYINSHSDAMKARDMILARTVCKSNYKTGLINHFVKDMYKSSIGDVKNIKKVIVRYNENTDYDTLKIIPNVKDEFGTANYLIKEINSLDLYNEKAELILERI